MNNGLGLSRRSLLVSIGGSALLMPLYHQASAATNRLTVDDTAALGVSKKSTTSRFVSRDFFSNRLELIRLLKEVTEVEHSLMLQYLYASFSIKPTFSSLIGDGSPNSHSLLGVAVQEMQHLGSINKLLVALGATPNLDVQDFPYEIDIYPFPMSLEPLSRHSVAKFTFCEANTRSIAADDEANAEFARQLHTVLGDERGINHVGSVYATLLTLLDDLHKTDRTLRLDFDFWTTELTRIMQEGEDHHFAFFKSVFMGTHPAFKDAPKWWQFNQHSQEYPAFDTVSNPTAFHGHDHQIKDSTAQQLAWLANLHYWSVLVLLNLHYRSSDASAKYLAVGCMLLPLKSLGSELAKRGYGIPFDRLSLGYSPSQNAAENIGFAIQLQKEADQVRNNIIRHLPADYPQDIELSNIVKLQELAAAWSKKWPIAASGKTIFSV